MREPLKSMLKNLPKCLYFNEEENDLYAYCEDCGKVIHYEIRQRNIKEGPYYCRNCSPKHRFLSDEARQNISKGSKKRTGDGICNICKKPKKNRNAAGVCPDCFKLIKIHDKNKKPGICTNPDCGCYNKERYQNGRGKDIGYGIGEWIAENDILDESTGKIIVHKGEKCGCNCSQQFYIDHNNQENMIEHSVENLNKINERHLEFCEKCGKETLHTGFGACLICFPNAGGNSVKYLYKRDNVRFWKDELVEDVVNGLLNGTKSFDDYPELENIKGHICYNEHDILTDDIAYFTNYLTEKNNIRLWKNERADELVKDLLSGKKNIKDYHQLEIKGNHICYMNKDILTDEKIIYKNGRSPLQIIDNIEFIHLPEIGDILKDEYFNKLKKEIDSISSNDEIDNLINNEDFVKEFIVKTGKENWSRKLTNQMLKEKDYKYICYIKLFKNKPFIVGITGTTLVHESEIDFDFIIGDNNDPSRTGIGRQFLREKYPEVEYTDFDYILCKNFETEKEAKEYEKYIASKYNLFQS